MYYWLYASSGRIKRTGVGAFGIYLAAIVGLHRLPEPVVLLIAVAASMVVVGNLSGGEFKTTAVLSGYSSGYHLVGVFCVYFKRRVCNHRLR